MKELNASESLAEISVPEPWAGRQRRALAIGIDQYRCPNLHNLKGCSNDAELLATLMTESYGFGVVRLLDDQATRQRILHFMAMLLDISRPGDEVLFLFSGHGSRLLTAHHGSFETLVPHDSHRRGKGSESGPNRDITDREIYGWILQLSERIGHVTLIMDACRAGGIVRDLESRPRGVWPDCRLDVLEDKTAFLLLDAEDDIRDEAHVEPSTSSFRVAQSRPIEGRWLPPSDRYTLLAACKDDQFCREMTDPESGQVHGILSLSLVRELRGLAHQPTLSWRQLRDRIARRVEGVNTAQTVQLEGAVDREVLGQRILRPEIFLPVLQLDDEAVELGGGIAHGVVLGSKWRLFEPSALHSNGEELGTVQVHQVSSTRAQAGNGAMDFELIEIGSRAFESFRPIEHRMRVLVDPEAGKARTAVTADIAESPLLTLVDQPVEADVTLRYLPANGTTQRLEPLERLGVSSSSRWALIDAPSQSQLAPWQDCTPSPAETAAQLTSKLEKMARQRSLLQLDHPTPERSLVSQVDVDMLRRAPRGDWEKIAPGDPLALGDRFALRLRRKCPESADSQKRQPLYVAMLDLGISSSISVLYPRRGRRIAWKRDVLEIGMRPDDPLHVRLPKGYPYPGEPTFQKATETVLILITRRFTDLDLLAQDGFETTRTNQDSPIFSILQRALGLPIQRTQSSENLLAHPEQWGLIRCPFQVVPSL